MKQKILSTLIFCILLTSFAFSQDGPPNRPPNDGPKDGKRPTAEEMVKMEMKMIKENLNLSETQVTFVQKILEDSYKKMEDNFSNGKKDMDEMTKIMQEKDENLKRVLTEEQWTKYLELKAKNKDKFKQGDKPPSDRQKPKDND
jgi:hypothetical protein